MEDLAALFKAFYTHFVLRDLLAKITPGAIVLVAISTIFIWQPENVAQYLAELTFWAWTIFLAFSWITGITIQSIGEWLETKKEGWGIRYYPKKDIRNNDFDRKEWYKLRVEFLKRANRDEILVDERFVVIKEACGNGFIALLIVSILLAVKILGIFIYWIISKKPSILSFIQRLEDSLVVGGSDDTGVLLIGLIIAIIFIFALHRMHKEHVQRQYDHMLTVMDC